MKFKKDVVRSIVMAGLAASLLASCGGSTESEEFVPNRIIAFGDESSYIESDGRKYTVNAVVMDTTVTPPVPTTNPPTLSCSVNQVWVQILASNYGMAFSQCPIPGFPQSALMYAQPATGSAGLSAQVDRFLADRGAFTNKDLIGLMTGLHDILSIYRRLGTEPGITQATMLAAAQQAGTAVGAQVVRITNAGAKVVVSTVPSLGLTPFAYAEELAHPGEGRRALLSEMSKQFNGYLRLKLEEVRDGGHAVGLILSDELVSSMTALPANYSLTNAWNAACTVALPDCNQLTLVDGASAGSGWYWLWADDMRMGANAHNTIGSLAVNRARSNPF